MKKNIWTEQEILNVINVIEIAFKDKKLNLISRKIIEDLYKNVQNINHSLDSFVALVYNIIYILTNEKYGLSGYSKKLKECVDKFSKIQYDQQTDIFKI